MNAYAVTRKYKTDKDNSSTVGLATFIAEYYIKHNNVVYCSVLSENFQVKFVRIVDLKRLAQISGSKYFQSNLSDTFLQVENDLIKGRQVLFVGTPCQVLALKNLLEIKQISREKLFLIDLVCHGVGSPYIFREWGHLIERVNGSEIDSISFRDKKYGWTAQKWTVQYKNGLTETDEYFQKVLKNLYYGAYIIRPSCHKCIFTNKNRHGDLTLGDFWNIKDVDPALYTENGVGLVFENSEQARDMIEICRAAYTFHKVPVESCDQPQLNKPVAQNKNRCRFWSDMKKLPFERIAKKYDGVSFKRKVFEKITKRFAGGNND